MSEEVQEAQPQSDILSTEEVQAVVETGELPEESAQDLPSEQSAEELIAGKFKSQDDLLKAYKELEAKLGQPKEESESEEMVTTEVTDPEYVEWRRNKAEEALLADVGGVQEYKKAQDWASQNLPEQEVAAFNKALDEAKGNESVIKVLAKSLIDKYQIGTAEQPVGAPIHSSSTTRVDSPKGYATKSDMMKDMADPRYERDEGYRQQVARKVEATDESQWYATLPKY
jgi:hypothetical protein